MNTTIISNYLHYCKTYRHLSQHTIRAYKNDLTQFINFGSINIKLFLEEMVKKNIKSATIKRKMASLKSFYRYLENENIISENPFATLRFQYKLEKTLPKVITYNNLNAIYTYLHNQISISKNQYKLEKSIRNYLIVSILLSTGIRISELCNISICNIHLDNRTLTIFGKGNKERIIYIGHEKTFQLLKKYISDFHLLKHQYLFLGKNKLKHLEEQSVRFMLKQLSKKLKLDIHITPHMFRHTFATMLLDNNVDIRHIQQILGHSSISITEIYTHVSYHKQQEILTYHNPINILMK